MIAIGFPALLLGVIFLKYDIAKHGLYEFGPLGVVGCVLSPFGIVLIAIPAFEWMWVNLP